MGLDDPTAKMSKMGATRGHAIGMVDEPDEIRFAFSRAVTDSGREIKFSSSAAKAGVNNLLVIYQLLTGNAREQIEEHFAGRGYGDLKRETAEVTIEALRPIRERYRELMGDPGEIDRLLTVGAERARAVATPKLVGMKERVGFLMPVGATAQTVMVG
jgi:tryptophanyl-tRNA synthetase